MNTYPISADEHGGVLYAHTSRALVSPRLDLDGDDVAMLAERASGQQAKRTSGGKYIGLPCPFEDHENPKPTDFVIFPSGVGKCLKCETSANASGIIAAYQQTSREAAWQWITEQMGRRWQPRQTRPPAHPPTDVTPATHLDPALLSAIYCEMAALLGLNERHAAFDPKRGQTAAEMRQLGYTSLPEGMGRSDKRASVAGLLAAKYGDGVLAAVPGFYRARPGEYWTIGGPAGILLPTRDVQGRITRYKVAADNPKEGKKYTWLASPSICRRCRRKCQQLDAHPDHTRLYPATPATAHTAVPSNLTDPRIWITEGPRKADIAAARLGAVVIAAPGAGVQAPVIAAIGKVAGLARPQMVIAFDQDPTGKGAALKLATKLTALGYVVEMARWTASKQRA